jgi:hypothetical protein
MAFSFLQPRDLRESARLLTLAPYNPEFRLQNLTPGVDNVRHDVWLSPAFRKLASSHILKLVAQYGGVADLMPAAAEASVAWRPPSIVQPKQKPQSEAPQDFKSALADLQIGALNRARTDGNINVDLLARLALLKFLRSELLAQFAEAVERCRARLSTYEASRHGSGDKAHEVRERTAKLQVNKKHVLRKAGQDLFATLREVEKETVARTRRAFFSDNAAVMNELLMNRLLFTEDGRDDYLNAEHYVMLGNYERDADRAAQIGSIAADFLQELDVLERAGQFATYDALLSEPQNAQELVAGGSPENSEKGKAQKHILQAWQETLERAGVMDLVVAAYEAAPLLPQYWPHVHAQQLKLALVSKEEHGRIVGVLNEHGKISLDALSAARKRVEACKGGERTKIAARFLRDYMRYRRDLRRMEAVTAGSDKVNVIINDKLRELSAINNTLYEFLLSAERSTAEERVTGHVIIKADVRDSTTLTRTLLERGLNPASFFSLNFYDPVNKLLARFGASKVFIEGDAVILAILEREGESQPAVARACVLAREMVQLVRGCNEQAQGNGLPTIEVGIGISYQDSAPMYLVDGNARIMISSALNESDRLSSCHKTTRKLLAGRSALFNVFTVQPVREGEAGDDEALLSYNISGVKLSAPAFARLRQEIALHEHAPALKQLMWPGEKVMLFSGSAPVGAGGFAELIVREAQVPAVDPKSFALKQWTATPYFEVCTNAAVTELVRGAAASA